MSSTRLVAILAIAQLVSAQAAPTQTGTAAAAAAAAAKAAAAALQQKAALFHQDFYNYIFIVLGSLIAALLVWRVGTESVKYVRTMTSLGNGTQSYFKYPSEKYASFKKHVLYAPLFRKRHNREFQLSSALNVGTLPTRLQLLFLLSYFGTNVAFCVVSIDWDQPFATAAKELRNRTGILAMVNMVPLFIMAGRNNPLISWIGLSFDTFNLLHRWFGRIVVLEALAHTIAWGAATFSAGGWAAIQKAITTDPMVKYGFIVGCHS